MNICKSLNCWSLFEIYLQKLIFSEKATNISKIQNTLQAVLALCKFHYCGFHYCGFSKLLVKFGWCNFMGYLFCYCVHKIKILLMRIFPGRKSSIRREPSLSNIKLVFEKYMIFTYKGQSIHINNQVDFGWTCTVRIF